MKAPISVKYVALDSLHPDPMYSRRMTDEEVSRLEHSIRTDGIICPLVATRAEGILIDGTQRLLVARRFRFKTVPVIHPDVSLDHGRQMGLAINRIRGDFDPKLLPHLVAHLSSIPGIDLAATGFPADEMSALLSKFELDQKRSQLEFFDLDAAMAEATRQPRAKLGQIWHLNDHRLMCGDATSSADVGRLLDGSPAQMAFTDPPYNVDLGAHGGQTRGSRRRPMLNDALSAEAWAAFAGASATNLVASVDGAIYVCMSCKEWASFSNVMAAAGAHWSDTIIWKKDRFVVGRADYQHGFEPIWYGWRDGAKRHWSGARDQSDVWDIARPSDSPLHASMKPLALIERAIDNSSRVGDRVLDPFMGSGSTLIACERTGRVSLGIELNPILIDVAIRRWERFMGDTAALGEVEA